MSRRPPWLVLVLLVAAPIAAFLRHQGDASLAFFETPNTPREHATCDVPPAPFPAGEQPAAESTLAVVGTEAVSRQVVHVLASVESTAPWRKPADTRLGEPRGPPSA